MMGTMKEYANTTETEENRATPLAMAKTNTP